MRRDLEAGSVRFGDKLAQLGLREQELPPEPTVDEDLHPANPQSGAELLPGLVALIPRPEPLVLVAEGQVGIHPHTEVTRFVQGP